MPWVFGKLTEADIRICEECGEVTSEWELHWHPPTSERILLTEEEQAKFKGHGEATVENVTTGEKSKVEFAGEATVTSLEEKKQEKEGEHLCPECGDEQTRHGNRWICTNVSSCSLAQSQATSGSSRTTAKAVAASAPRAFSRSGRVD